METLLVSLSDGGSQSEAAIKLIGDGSISDFVYVCRVLIVTNGAYLQYFGLLI